MSHSALPVPATFDRAVSPCCRKNSVAGPGDSSSVGEGTTSNWAEQTMNASRRTWVGFTGVGLCAIISGCASDPNRIGITNQRHPGPAVGRAVGTGVGVAAGNVAGGVVGFGEGVAVGAAAPFDSSTRVVRRWPTETTADGRAILVPGDIVVGQYRRPLNPPPAA